MVLDQFYCSLVALSKSGICGPRGPAVYSGVRQSPDKATGLLEVAKQILRSSFHDCCVKLLKLNHLCTGMSDKGYIKHCYGLFYLLLKLNLSYMFSRPKNLYPFPYLLMLIQYVLHVCKSVTAVLKSIRQIRIELVHLLFGLFCWIQVEPVPETARAGHRAGFVKFHLCVSYPISNVRYSPWVPPRCSAVSLRTKTGALTSALSLFSRRVFAASLCACSPGASRSFSIPSRLTSEMNIFNWR